MRVAAGGREGGREEGRKGGREEGREGGRESTFYGLPSLISDTYMYIKCCKIASCSSKLVYAKHVKNQLCRTSVHVYMYVHVHEKSSVYTVPKE